MSDANRVQVAYVEEGTFAGKVSGSNLQILRYKGETLKQDTGTTMSEEIRSDRQVSDIARIGVSASGGVDFELSYGSHDDFLKAALQSAGWSSEVKITASRTISVVSGDNSINDSANEFGSFVVNQWVYVSGFSDSANNGFKKISSVTAGKIIISNGTLVTETAGAGITVQMGEQIINGTSLTTFNIEKDFQDLNTVFGLMKGMAINQLALDVPADNIITGSFDFMGSSEEPLSASAGSGYDAATVSTIMTGANHVTNFFENLTELPILSLALNLNNNLRTRLQVGNLGVASIGSGAVEVTGTVTLYMSDASLYQKYLDLDTTSIVFAARDTQGNGYLIELPSVKIIDGTRNSTALNTDVVGTFEFRAYMDASELVSVRIVRFPVMSNFYGLVSATSSLTGALTI